VNREYRRAHGLKRFPRAVQKESQKPLKIMRSRELDFDYPILPSMRIASKVHAHDLARPCVDSLASCRCWIGRDLDLELEIPGNPWSEILGTCSRRASLYITFRRSRRPFFRSGRLSDKSLDKVLVMRSLPPLAGSCSPVDSSVHSPRPRHAHPAPLEHRQARKSSLLFPSSRCSFCLLPGRIGSKRPFR